MLTFAPAFDEESVLSIHFDRDLAQLVAHTSGGREVAGSSPVIPTEAKELETKGFQLLFLFARKFTLNLKSDGNRYGIRH